MASAVGGSSIEAPKVSAILLDAGGVLVFPEPANLLPPLREAGVDPDLATLERAHYHAMAAQDRQATPPAPATWWRDYLTTYVAACGVAEARCEQLAIEIAGHPQRYGWAHAGLGVKDGLRALAGLGAADGRGLQLQRHRRGRPAQRRCLLRAGRRRTAAGRACQMGVILDSAVVGVAKPDPGIFRIALDALNVPADGSVLHVGDSLRYDVAGAHAAGLQPVHMDPYGLCPAPDGHPHIRSLAELARSLISNPR